MRRRCVELGGDELLVEVTRAATAAAVGSPIGTTGPATAGINICDGGVIVRERRGARKEHLRCRGDFAGAAPGIGGAGDVVVVADIAHACAERAVLRRGAVAERLAKRRDRIRKVLRGSCAGDVRHSHAGAAEAAWDAASVRASSSASEGRCGNVPALQPAVPCDASRDFHQQPILWRARRLRLLLLLRALLLLLLLLLGSAATDGCGSYVHRVCRMRAVGVGRHTPRIVGVVDDNSARAAHHSVNRRRRSAAPRPAAALLLRRSRTDCRRRSSGRLRLLRHLRRSCCKDLLDDTLCLFTLRENTPTFGKLLQNRLLKCGGGVANERVEEGVAIQKLLARQRRGGRCGHRCSL